MLCLSHTLEHRAIAGEHHHDEGDAAGATVELVILSFAAAFMAAAVGGCLRSQGPRSIVRPTIVTWVPSPVPTPTARAGPVVLGVSRT